MGKNGNRASCKRQLRDKVSVRLGPISSSLPRRLARRRLFAEFVLGLVDHFFDGSFYGFPIGLQGRGVTYEYQGVELLQLAVCLPHQSVCFPNPSFCPIAFRRFVMNLLSYYKAHQG
jgi:hypothetical protein